MRAIGWTIATVTLLHFIWGFLILLSPEPLGVSPLHGLQQVFHDRYVLATVYIVASTMATAALFFNMRGVQGFLMVAPQQAILLITAGFILQLITNGQYPDGVQRAPVFLAADQLLYVIIAFVHTVGVTGTAWRQSR